jgi:hypothetical protein
MCRNAWSFSRRPTGRPQNQHDLSQCCLFRPSLAERTFRARTLSAASSRQRGADDRGRERCPRPIGCCAFGRRLSAVMSRAGAADIPDAAGSATCLVLSQASDSPAFEQCQWSRDTGKVPNQSSIRFWYSCRQNSPVAARLSSPFYDFSSPHDRPIRRPTARFPFG